MKNMKKYLLTLVLTASLYQTYGQITERHFNTWWTKLTSIELNENWSLGTELHVRRSDGLEKWQQFLFRPYFDYHVNEHITASAGYTYIMSYPYREGSINLVIPEHNFWEQITLNHSSGKLKFSHRYRLEHRFIGNVKIEESEAQIDGNRFTQRFRYRYTLSFPILSSEKWFIAAFDEIWINMERGILPTSLNQNWLHAALGYNLGSVGNLQVGYLNQIIVRGSGELESNATIQTTLVLKL